MHPLALLFNLLLIATVLWDAFETLVLPRTVSRRLRLTGLYFRATWSVWSLVATLFFAERRRERFLAVYGPLSLLGLAGVWALGLVVGFAGLQWAAGSNLRPAAAGSRFMDDLYMSGTTFFTLGLGDLRPVGQVARFLAVAEAGTGFAFLALVIAYFPVLYQSFARREAQLTLLDAWAGSPPAAAEVLRRLAARGEITALDAFLKDWEYWHRSCSRVTSRIRRSPFSGRNINGSPGSPRWRRSWTCRHLWRWASKACRHGRRMSHLRWRGTRRST